VVLSLPWGYLERKRREKRGGACLPDSIEGLAAAQPALATARPDSGLELDPRLQPAGGGAGPAPQARRPISAGAVAGVRRLFSTGSTPGPTCRSSGFRRRSPPADQLDGTTSPCLRATPPAGESRSGDVPPAVISVDCRAALRLRLQPAAGPCPPAAATCAICCSAIPPVIPIQVVASLLRLHARSGSRLRRCAGA